MTPFPPRPEAVAHWLLAYEADAVQYADGGGTAAARVHAQLRTGLVVFLGPTGFDSLWARAQYLAQPPASANAVATVVPPDAPDGPDDSEAVLASFIALLFRFVGAVLSVRLLHQLWPTLPIDAADFEPSDDAV